MILKRKHLILIFALTSARLRATNAEEDILGFEERPEEGKEEAVTPKPTPKEFEIVSLEHGDIKGALDWSTQQNPFYTFLGIPYALPPTGDRRFKDPEIVREKWDGIRDGSKAPPPCAQFDINELILKPKASFVGEEDCLYLNIYTPEPNIESAELPVLVYIHGGHFASGSAMDYEPHHIMSAPVVLVVVQYRLGVLGFLSTEDLVMPGNLGLKDQTMALKWVHNFIEKFGGDPTKITLFGSGSGAASVHYQMMSHHTIGLFQRAILQSGNSLCPWAKGGVHKEAAYHIGKYFSCFPQDEEEDAEGKEEEDDSHQGNEGIDADEGEKTIEEPAEEESEGESVGREENSASREERQDVGEEMQESPDERELKGNDDDDRDSQEGNANKVEPNADEETADEIEEEETEEEKKNKDLLSCLQDVDVEKLVMSAELFYMWSYLPVIFGPYVDGRYIPESTEFLLKMGRHKRVDLIIGINREDGGLLTHSMFVSEGRRMALRHHFPLVGPLSMEFSDDDVAPLNMTIKAYDKYCGGLNIDASDANNLTKLYTDRHYGICADTAAEWHSANNKRYKKNVYFYEMTHRGQRSTSDAFGLNVGKEWVSLGDELFYLFPFNKSKEVTRDEDDEKMTELFVRMWYYFAATGNPTPSGTLEFTWEPYTNETKHHLLINPSPSMEADNRKEERDFWTKMPTRQNIFFNKEYFLNILRAETNEGKEGDANDGDESGRPPLRSSNSSGHSKTEL